MSIFVKGEFCMPILTHQQWAMVMNIMLYSAWSNEGLCQLPHHLVVNQYKDKA